MFFPNIKHVLCTHWISVHKKSGWIHEEIKTLCNQITCPWTEGEQKWTVVSGFNVCWAPGTEAGRGCGRLSPPGNATWKFHVKWWVGDAAPRARFTAWISAMARVSLLMKGSLKKLSCRLDCSSARTSRTRGLREDRHSLTAGNWPEPLAISVSGPLLSSTALKSRNPKCRPRT